MNGYIGLTYKRENVFKSEKKRRKIPAGGGLGPQGDHQGNYMLHQSRNEFNQISQCRLAFRELSCSLH